ncbi:hypothetical protein JTE90_028568 [Oedothorax gibbosus]|uniref:FHA domain-containing protein n=1 Tax=Oedothorax gibbosus TaxID=931172 RepID=A0AAV6VWF6_9ARAC|nr:hypothetical protein JTE90_028568 [Oedothorax gibbosus]
MNDFLKRYCHVSPSHAYLVKKRGGWFVKELDSTYGTYVNSVRIGSRLQKLQLGDQIGFGAKGCGEGFICALDFKRLEKKAPEVVDLVEDDFCDVQPPVATVIGRENIHNIPSTSEVHQLRKCCVPLIRCDSEAFKISSKVRLTVGKRLSEVECSDEGPSHKLFKNNFGKKSKLFLDPYKMLKECAIPLVRCDSPSFSLPRGVQLSTMPKEISTDASHCDIPSDLSKNEKRPKKPKVTEPKTKKVVPKKLKKLKKKIFQKKTKEKTPKKDVTVVGVTGLVNRRKLDYSSDSSNSDRLDSPKKKVVQRKNSSPFDSTESTQGVPIKEPSGTSTKFKLLKTQIHSSDIYQVPETENNLKKSKKSLGNENIKSRFESRTNDSSSRLDHEDYSNSSVESMDYAITPNNKKNKDLDSFEAKKNEISEAPAAKKPPAQHSSSSGGLNNYLKLLNETKSDSVEGKSSPKKVRKTIEVEPLPLRSPSKKFNREETLTKRKLEGSTSKSETSNTKNSHASGFNKFPSDAIKKSPFTIPKVSKSHQQKKESKNLFNSPKNIETSKSNNSSSNLDKTYASTSKSRQNAKSFFDSLWSKNETKDFKKRPKNKDRFLVKEDNGNYDYDYRNSSNGNKTLKNNNRSSVLNKTDPSILKKMSKTDLDLSERTKKNCSDKSKTSVNNIEKVSVDPSLLQASHFSSEVVKTTGSEVLGQEIYLKNDHLKIQEENTNLSNIPVIVSNRIVEACQASSVVNSNLTVLSPPCNLVVAAESLTNHEDMDCSDLSDASSYCIETKDTNEILMSTNSSIPVISEEDTPLLENIPDCSDASSSSSFFPKPAAINDSTDALESLISSIKKSKVIVKDQEDAKEPSKNSFSNSSCADALESLISSIKKSKVIVADQEEPKEPSKNSSSIYSSCIASKLSELVRRTKYAAHAPLVDSAKPCSSLAEISDIVPLISEPSTSKRLTDLNIATSPKYTVSTKTSDPTTPPQVLELNRVSHHAVAKLQNLETFIADPRLKSAKACTEQSLNPITSDYLKLHGSKSTDSPVLTPCTYNISSNNRFTELGTLSPILDKLPSSNERLHPIQANGIPGVLQNQQTLVQKSKINPSINLSDSVAKSCNEQLSRVQNRVSSTDSIDKPYSVKVSFLWMVKTVVNWNLKWLEEQAIYTKPPPQISKGAAKLPLSFNTYDDYVSAFIPMVMLEIWKKMFEEYKMICEEKLLSNEFHFIITSFDDKKDLEMCEYNCEALIDKSAFEPCEGNLIIMHVKDIKDKDYHMLCYIHMHKTEQLCDDNLNPEWNKVCDTSAKNATLYKFSVYAKLRPIPMTPAVNSIMEGNGLCSIKNKLILGDAFQKLKVSPLCSSVLYPQTDVFSVKHDTGNECTQEAAVDSLSCELRKPLTTPKILCLRGPPGTGKTYIIVSLLQKVIHADHNKVKILMTAPTDVAVDELGCRLIKKKINFIRFGPPRFINERIKPFTLEERAKKLKRDCIRKTEQRKEQLDKLLTDIAVMKVTDSNCEKKLRPLIKDKLALEKKIFLETSVDTSQRDFQQEVLKNADVILTTLSGCADPLMSIFKHDSPLAFTSCIIDHASQCTEMDVLPALAFGASKLVLVGDRFQLSPIVTSKWTNQYEYNRSMFERFHYFSSKYQSMTPSLTLQTQYRMHSEICHFPSKQFYNNGLRTAPEVDVKYASFPLHPYIVYDVSERHEPKLTSSSEYCANFVLNICNQLVLIEELTNSIGIIVPFREDRSLFSKKLSKQKTLLKNIEVNTVDGFQGKEKDMILMFCVSSSVISRPSFLNDSKRLNVALTRARKCLIICIGSSSFKQTEIGKNLVRDATDRGYATSMDLQSITLTFLPTMLKNKA